MKKVIAYVIWSNSENKILSKFYKTRKGANNRMNRWYSGNSMSAKMYNPIVKEVFIDII